MPIKDQLANNHNKNYMKKIAFYFLILLSSVQSIYSQDLEKLKENNGFRDIKLGSDVQDNLAFIKKDSTNIKYFGVWTEYDYIFNHSYYKGYDKIGDVEIYRVFVKTFNDKIFDIRLILEKDFEVIELLNLAYGKATFDSLEGDSLYWKIDNIECGLSGRWDGIKNFYLTYIDTKLQNEFWKNEREKKKQKAIKEF